MSLARTVLQVAISALWLLLTLYVAACVASIAVIFTSGEALSGVFAVMLATPWMFVVEALEPDGMWALLPVVAAMALNAAILYVCILGLRRFQ